MAFRDSCQIWQKKLHCGTTRSRFELPSCSDSLHEYMAVSAHFKKNLIFLNEEIFIVLFTIVIGMENQKYYRMHGRCFLNSLKCDKRLA